VRKFIVASLSVAFLAYVFLVSRPVSVPGNNAGATSQQPLSIHSKTLGKAEGPKSPASLRERAEVESASTTLSDIAGSDSSSADRKATLRRLAGHNEVRLYATLWQTLEADDPHDAAFRDFALSVLAEQGDIPPGEILAALIRTAPTAALRRSALHLLAEASQELTVAPFNRALHDPDLALHRAASEFFEGLEVDTMLDAVAGALLDRDRAVRLTAFSTLEEMHARAPFRDVAELLLQDPDPGIRLRALELITYGDREGAVDRLLPALGDPNPRVSERAAALLTEYGHGPS
jgi:HEAT repeat protein